eukprot:TRINITY_DN9685_c0_g1_i1.p1 TRINITY_DN9685_c0_g1~~TRINITY_DN9685_c0_g1_i1.p1  ORF type:complete len:1465 (-),score=349.19 TRINITY_DN9685_c0_g1_i1:88-4482(-)
MPMPALTLPRQPSLAFPPIQKVPFRKESRQKLGSFRNCEDIKSLIPRDLYSAIFDDVPDDLDVNNLIAVDEGHDKHYLNNAAFGRAYEDVLDLSFKLKRFAETHPDIFYDQACLPLINHTYEVLEDFFATENVVLVPNCTFGLKSVIEHLVREKGHKNLAQLTPVYGATQKLMDYYRSTGDIDKVLKITPGRGHNALLEEDPAVIVEALEDAYALQEFTVLFCDQVASQTGRVLSLDPISKFCKDNNIVLVVDGTQSCQLFFGKHKKQLQNVDFFVMSTHKWISNVKTCGVVVFKDLNSAPCPPAISFGWEHNHSHTQSIAKIRTSFQWLGMLDSYISYITLSKALKIFRKYGEAQMIMASATLEKGIADVLHLKPMLPKTYNARVINIVELENAQFEPMGDVSQIQNAFQDYGIYVSVKKYGQGCADNTTEHYVDTHLNGNQNEEDDQCPTDTCTRKRKISGTVDVCTKAKQKFYIRISCWSFNKKENFESLKLVFNNNLKLSTSSNSALRHQFLHTFEMYEKLFSVLKTKGFFYRGERLRHHPIFYYAHTAVFFINKLVVSGYLPPMQRIDPRLESVMSVGVDEMSWDDILEDNYEWTSMSDEEHESYLWKIKSYRQQVKDLILNMLDANPVVHPIAQGSFHWVLLMGFEHEKIHLETSAVIISQVPIDLIKKNHEFNFRTYYDEKSDVECPADAPSNTLVRIPGGEVTMGKDFYEQDLYGWDNEFGNERKTLNPFTSSQMLVSNAEYLEFVQAGGYEEKGREWWSEEGWRYVQDLAVSGPRFWIDRTHYRALLDIIPMPWDFPVEVNNLEADAFCKWKSSQVGKKLRLISHEESFHMRQIAKKQTSNSNLNKYASPTPVNLYGGQINGKNVYDISGNVWRHSVSVLTIMEGFKTDPFYNDFTLPTIDGFHNHILGGSWISLGNSSNLNARYGFRRHFYQYAGIRYVCSENDYHEKVMRIFDGVAIGQQITEHFSDFTDPVLMQKKPIQNWPEKFGQMAAEHINKEAQNISGKVKVLFAHGGVGRSVLEIMRGCQDLIIDYTDTTANNLQVLEHLLEHKKIQWYQQVEGKLVEHMEFNLNDWESSERLLKDEGNSISYWQADYTNLRPQLDGYAIIVTDFRIKDTAQEIKHLSSKLIEGGLLIMGGIEEVTGKGIITGRSSPVAQRYSLSVLEKYFNEIPCDEALESYAHIYKETRNKHQYAISNFSIWRKKMDHEIDEDELIDEVQNSVSRPETTAQYYEDQSILTSYDQFHFGEGLLGIKNFPQKMAEVCIEACQKFKINFDVALDAGCGPGRTAMELCKVFTKVEAYDYSQSFVDMMLENKSRKGLENLTAYQGDSHIQNQLTTEKFDLIFGCNLIDRLHTPIDWVKQSQAMLREGGLLIIASPYTWKPEHTPNDKWLGGYLKDAENHFTVDGLKEAVMPDLVLLEEKKVPFVIPDADGTFQYTYSNCTIFGAASKQNF